MPFRLLPGQTWKEEALDGVIVFHEAADREAALVIGAAAGEALRFAGRRWGLRPPADLQVHALASWEGFLFVAAPWPWRLYLLITFPLWVWRVRRVWRVAGGWTQRFGRRLAVGVKPPRLLLQADRELGRRLFRDETDLGSKMRQIAWHETVHACTLDLRLPAWLNEGLAMFAVDLLADKPTVLPETLDWMTARDAASGRGYPSHSRKRGEAFLRLYAQGYWRVRYLEERHPGLLRELLGIRRQADDWLRPIADACAVPKASGWAAIDRKIHGHFRKRQDEAQRTNSQCS